LVPGRDATGFVGLERQVSVPRAFRVDWLTSALNSRDNLKPC
jgi:hypothetical protein